MKLAHQIESILLYKNEPVALAELSKLLSSSEAEVAQAVSELQEEYRNRGIVIVGDGRAVSLGTSPENAALIESLTKEELSRELGRAGLETLAVVLYRGPISRREIDQIRGVNSGFILRSLLIRGLIEKADSAIGERSFTYQPTLSLFEHLGITKREELPEYREAFKKMAEFVKESDSLGENQTG